MVVLLPLEKGSWSCCYLSGKDLMCWVMALPSLESVVLIPGCAQVGFVCIELLGESDAEEWCCWTRNCWCFFSGTCVCTSNVHREAPRPFFLVSMLCVLSVCFSRLNCVELVAWKQFLFSWFLLLFFSLYNCLLKIDPWQFSSQVLKGSHFKRICVKWKWTYLETSPFEWV